MKKNESSAQKWIQKGRRVWVKANNHYPNPFQDAFLEGEIIDIESNKHARVFLTDSKQQFKIPLNDCLKLTYGTKDVSDMVDLQQLNQPQLLYNIKRRYIEDSIFTYCGPTLLIINPYSKIQKLFNDNVLQEYQSYVFSDTLQYKNLSPHIFSLAAFCLWQLFDNQRNQSIVISGQSGAGKTQNTKYCLKFLASLGKNMKQLINQSHSLRKSKISTNLRAAQRAIKKTNSKVYGIQEKILGCNEILEAFGNSKTIRNDNSSRFGKLILLVYGQTQIQIKSAFIISYLLQKSRIVSVSEGQRNYHIFYYLIKGTSQAQKKYFHLQKNIADYYYLNQSSVTSIPGVSDQQRFEEIKKQFQLYINEPQIDAVLKILSAVLNLGNIKFKKVQTQNTGEVAVVQNTEYLKVISDLLEVSRQQLQHCFQFKTRKMGVSVLSSPLKYEQAIALRDSFAKNIYEKTFNYLIKKMNEKIQIQQISLDDDKNSSNYRKSIGLLDIFGFEVLNLNSLEQFFINFANQKLQQLYVSYIFKEEQNQFMREGLKEFSHDIGFQDNKPIIDLFENYPLGIFHLVNQSSQLNQDDKDLPSSIQKNHSKNVFLKIPKAKRSCFEIVHSCSPVVYTTTGFSVKNKDQFPQQLLSLLEKTKSQPVLKICVGQETKQVAQNAQKGGRNAAKKFLGSKFLNSMNTLIQELYSCDCHFVRCIKPNSKKSPKLFNSEAVLQSLRYLGVLDSIIIRKLGYIYRRPFKQFYKKFYQLDNYIFSFHEDVNKLKTEDDFKKESQKIITKYIQKELEENNILLGHKKILIKQSTLNHLQLLLKQKRKLRISVANRFKTMYQNSVFRTKVKICLKSIKVLKTHLKLIVSDVKEKILINKVIKIQNVVKKYLWQKRLEKIKQEATKSVTKISAYFKMKRQRKIFLETRRKILQVQSNVRLYLTMGKILRQRNCRKLTKQLFQTAWKILEHKKAIVIQKICRGYQVRNKFKIAIETVKKNLRLSKIKARFKRALFQHNYNKFIQALNKYRNPIIKLQAIVKGKFLHRTYNLVKKNTILIQKVYRRHLKKRFYLQKQWDKFKNILKDNQRAKIQIMNKIGLKNPEIRINRQVNQTNGLLKVMLPNQMFQVYGSENIESNKKHIKKLSLNESIEFPDKNTLQAYILDYDAYPNSDNQVYLIDKFERLKSHLKSKMEYIISTDMTENTLIVVSNKDKLYRIKIKGNSEIEQFSGLGLLNKIQSSEKGSIISTIQQAKQYQWGNISLSQSHLKENKMQILPDSLINREKKLYSSKGETQFILTQDKLIEKTTVLKKENTKIFQIPNKVSIIQIGASYNFMHLLSNAGLIYSKGKNKRGQLGLGFISAQVKSLTLNTELKKLKQHFDSIQVGMGHTLAKSKLGYVYAWGDNSFGQSSAQKLFVQKPVRIQFESKPLKVFQIAAGIKASYFLTENLKVYALGASLMFQSKSKKNLVELSFLEETNLRAKYLNPVKFRCIWNRQQSLLIANLIDFSKCKEGSKSDAISKYAKTIAKQWIESTVYPPYREFIDNCLNLGDLRKLKFKLKGDNKGQAQKKKNEKIKPLEQLKMIIELRKTSSMFRQAARVQVQQFLAYLQNKNSQNWSQQQKQMHDFIMKEMKNGSK